ncbi:MAG: T9SS type A sorting domain-containing protein [Bacteroidota bacterium]|jgi:hypothetical protein
MKGMVLVRWMMWCATMLVCTGLLAQKTWDGEAGDSLWQNPRNWFPDGVPVAADHVSIDNGKKSGSYKILINGPDSIVIQTLTIKPNDNSQIILEITPSSTLPIALYINSSQRNIVLEKNATLINHTGASSGNIFSLNGKVYIKNGARYVHRTIRGNAYLVSRLEIDSASSKGVMEFDVPGNSGYTLSLSGRRLGTLELNANESLKKSYSGSGSNPLMIEGDLIVGKNVSFTSSLVKNIEVKGNLNIEGQCSLNPASPDSTGRSLLLNGEESKIMVNGKLLTGNYFNQFVIGSKKNILLSNLYIEKGWIIQNSPTILMMDTFHMKSSNGIRIHNGASVATAHPEGISKDTTKGGLRSSGLIMGDSLRILFNGNNHQETGSGIPNSIGSLMVNKKGTLLFTSPIEIKDSICLQNGICITDSIRLPVFKGKSAIGNDSAYIDGPIEYLGSDSAQITIPIGKKKRYAPIILDIYKNEKIRAEYVDSSYQTGGTQMAFPVKSINGSEYWKLNCMNIDSMHAVRKLIFYTNPKTSLNNTYVVRLNENMKWEMLPLISNNPIPYSIETKSDLKSSAYTTGWIQQVALSNQRFHLLSMKRNGRFELTWNYDSNENVLQYIIEASTNGNTFQSMDSLRAISTSSHTYTYEIKKGSANKLFFRISAIHKNNEVRFSNIILIQFDTLIESLYPNPCQNQLILETASDVQSAIWAITYDGKKIQLTHTKVGKTIRVDVSSLQPGIYYLQWIAKGMPISIRFLKI